MSGSQHNPNGRQSQLGSTWNPAMQVMQMANLLARSQQLTPAHLNDRGHTWHTPTPPPHMYLPAPSPPDPLQGLQAMKSAGGNSMYRHTGTPPDMYRHTPTPPEKHMMRGTPSPGDAKGSPLDIYQHMGPGRETRLRPDDILSFARQGSLDLSLGSRNGGTPPAHPAHPASPALSVRDAPTINSLIARAAPRRVDSLLERLVPSPHSVIVHSRAANTPSPPSSNEDSADSCGAPPGSKRKRKPERTMRMPAALLPPPPVPSPVAVVPSLPGPHPRGGTVENGDAEHAITNGPLILPSPVQENPSTLPALAHKSPVSKSPRSSPATRAKSPIAGNRSPYAGGKSPVASSKLPVAGDRSPAAGDRSAVSPRLESPRTVEERSRRKTRSGSAETIADIAAMIAGGGTVPPPAPPATPMLSVDKLQSVLGSPETAVEPDATHETLTTTHCIPTAPRRRSARPSTSPRSTALSPSEAVPEPLPSTGGLPAPAIPDLSMAEVENQLEIMFAGLEEPQGNEAMDSAKDPEPAPATKRRKSTAGRGRTEPQPRRRGPRKKPEAKVRKLKEATKETKEYDSGSNASSGKSRGPYIQIRGGRADGSPMSVCVMNAATGDEEEWTRRREARPDTRRRGLHASTLGLRYDAATRDLTWLCAFCARPPHASGLGDLFGPYPVDTDLQEYRVLEEASRRRATCVAGANGRLEAWLHAACGVWAPGVLACGARVHGLAQAVWGAASVPCGHCTRGGAPLACSGRACPARAHLPCAREHGWRLDEEDFRALCPNHTPHPVPQ